MQLRHAIELLIEAAGRDLEGAGCGIRSLPEGVTRTQLCRAIDRCGQYAHRNWWRSLHPDGIEGHRHDEED